VIGEEGVMGRPIIGVTSELDAARWGDWIREAVVSPVTYIRAVERAGAAPVVIPPVPLDSVRALVAGLGGLVFTGGRDLNTELYEQQRLDETDPPDHRRDRFELALMRAAIEGGLPFLAIGRGLHVLTVARGGTLTQHLPAHRPDRARYLPHDVRLSPNSMLGRLLGTTIKVPAAHHQAPNRLGDGMVVAGWSPDDDVAEAVEVTDLRFGVGVHWHPEEGDDPRLMAAFVAAASEHSEEGERRGQSARRVEQSAKPATKPKAGARSR
jgi:gamma-glutamyl-gamma-aminobutyrate hydrolase PuuD